MLKFLQKGWKGLVVGFSILIAGGALAVNSLPAMADSACQGTLAGGYLSQRFSIDPGGCIHMNGSDAIDGADKGSTVARATYDFTVHGGGTTAFNLGVNNGAASTITLPANAVIYDGVLDVVTALDNTGGTEVQLSSEATGDILDKTASGIQSGRIALSPISAATSVKTTVARNVSMKISGSALTKGKVVLFLRYFVSG